MKADRRSPLRPPRRSRVNSVERLTPDQRREAARHVPLVQFQVSRQAAGARRGRVAGDADDLLQEGCVALLRAVQSYDADRHGQFAPYVMARVRYAVGQAAGEGRGGIHVPARVRKERRRRDRHDPRVVRGVDATVSVDRRLNALRGPAASPASEETTLAHLLRERYVALARDLVRELEEAPGGLSARTSLLNACLHERWLVPRESARTSIRALAERANCSMGTVTHCESLFYDRMRSLMAVDAGVNWIVRRAREGERGLARSLEPEELAEFRREEALRRGDPCADSSTDRQDEEDEERHAP